MNSRPSTKFCKILWTKGLDCFFTLNHLFCIFCYKLITNSDRFFMDPGVHLRDDKHIQTLKVLFITKFYYQFLLLLTYIRGIIIGNTEKSKSC